MAQPVLLGGSRALVSRWLQGGALLFFVLWSARASGAADPRAELEAEYKGYRSAVERSAFAEAQPHAARALAVGRSLYGAEHETTVMLELNLADLELQLARLDRAEPLYVHALATLEKLKGQRDLALLVPLNDLAEIRARAQHFAEARRYQQRALGVIEATYGGDHPATAHRLIALGILADSAGDSSAARAAFERAFEIRRKLFATAHPDLAECLYLLARAELRDQRYARAQGLYQEALGIWQRTPPADRRAPAAAQTQLAFAEQKLAEARAALAPPETPAEPITRSSPEYPAGALRKGVEGWVRLSFGIDAEGRVKNPAVVEAQPARVFNHAAIAALSSWKYKPRTVGGRPVEQPTNEVVLRFVLPASAR
jgi:TonB family protein